MNALQLYRDDGLLAPLLRARDGTHRLGWLAPPLARVVEYGSLIALTLVSAAERNTSCIKVHNRYRVRIVSAWTLDPCAEVL